MRKSGFLAALAAAFAIAPAAQAVNLPIAGLYNTGVSNTGTTLAQNGAIDSHWTITPAQTGLTSQATTYNVNPGGCTYVCVSDAAWLGVSGGGFQSYTYSLSFDMTGRDVTFATLSGLFGADNEASVYLNGHLLTSYLADHDTSYASFQAFQALHAFSADASDFVSGVNVLSFYVTDYDAPSALVVSGLGGTAALAEHATAPVPESSTWAMMILGFGLAGVALRRRRATLATA